MAGVEMQDIGLLANGMRFALARRIVRQAGRSVPRLASIHDAA
jgi:hypothetical protein